MNSVIDILKLKNWKYRNANSFFTKQIVEKSWNTTIDTVLYPTVNISELHSEVKKEKIIYPNKIIVSIMLQKAVLKLLILKWIL